MINVDDRPEKWAGLVARLMLARGATVEQLGAFFHAVFRPGP